MKTLDGTRCYHCNFGGGEHFAACPILKPSNFQEWNEGYEDALNDRPAKNANALTAYGLGYRRGLWDREQIAEETK